MCTQFNNRVGDRVAAIRAERMRHEMADLLEAERIRLNEVGRQVDMRAWHLFPADRDKQDIAKRMLTNAALIANGAEPMENS